jgi:hypothetical protein
MAIITANTKAEIVLELDDNSSIISVWMLYGNAEPIKVAFDRNSEIFIEMQKDIDNEIIKPNL